MGYNNAVKYAEKISFNLKKIIKKYGSKSENLKQTIDYILYRDK
jgi:farnesyl diphosphate synthase